MANKLQYVSDLADQTAHTVTHSIDGWKRYLGQAAQLIFFMQYSVHKTSYYTKDFGQFLP